MQALGVERHVGWRAIDPKQYCVGAVHASWPQGNVELGAPVLASPPATAPSVDAPASAVVSPALASTEASMAGCDEAASKGAPPQPAVRRAHGPPKRTTESLPCMSAEQCIQRSMPG